MTIDNRSCNGNKQHSRFNFSGIICDICHFRIKAAGCVLPLSNNLDLGKDMGTRHRACLGIAENSDAIAIVVSEETGIISMAKNGVLMRHFDRQTLYTRLVDEMIPKETASEKSAAEGWKARGKRLLNWVNNKEEDEQQ